MKIKTIEKMVPKMKSWKICFKIQTAVNFKVPNRNLTLVFKDLVYKITFRQFDAKVKILSDLNEIMCNSQFEGAE